MSDAKAVPPATLVIFGATGDLTRRLLMPAILNLVSDGLVGDDLSILGVAHSEGDAESLRQNLESFTPEAGGEGAADKGDPERKAAWARLRPRIDYLPGDFGDEQTFVRIRERLAQAGAKNVAFYLAVAPRFFGDIVEQLAKAGLLDEKEGFRRVAIEKPFGHDYESAKALNARILACGREDQFFRLDHFLGKDTVRNILMARFANTMVEAIWNNHYIDHVQITAAETVDVGERGSFYDANGALRDMVPNHLFQLLCMVGIEPPNSFDAESIRDEKAKLLRAIRQPDGEKDGVRGVYTAGTIGDHQVTSYTDAKDVSPDSRTETYAAMRLYVDSWRWAGVPFYLRTGKAMSHRDTEVVITLKPVPYALFRDSPVDKLPPNRLVIQVQPDEGIVLDMLVKRPGPITDPEPVAMRFRYADRFDIGHGTGYEPLIRDLLLGDQTLFQRADAIEASWRAVQPFLDVWGKAGKPEPYQAGSAGPAGADALIEQDGRHWHALGGEEP